MQSGISYLLVYSLFTGFGAYFVKHIHGLNSQQILFYRALLASLFLLAVALLSGRMKELKLRYPLNTLVMAATQGISIFFYFMALEKTTIANAILLTYTAPIFSAILASIFLYEKIERNTIAAIILSLIGVVIIADPSQISLKSEYFLGSLYALLGGFFYSAMAISSKSLTQKTTPLYAAFWQYFLIIFLFLIFALPIRFSAFTANAGPLLYLGWAAGGIAFLLYMEGIKRVKGQIIQIITMMEIVVGIFAGTVLLHERLRLLTIFGGMLILTGTFIVSIRKKK